MLDEELFNTGLDRPKDDDDLVENAKDLEVLPCITSKVRYDRRCCSLDPACHTVRKHLCRKQQGYHGRLRIGGRPMFPVLHLLPYVSPWP